MGRKAKGLLEAVVKDAAREAAEEHLEKRELELAEAADDTNDDDDTFLISTEQAPTRTSKTVKKIMSSFPSTEGFYGKIYKIDGDTGDWILKDYTITAPESMQDAEREIVDVIDAKGWGPGRYVFRVHNYNRGGKFFHQQHIRIGEPTPEEKMEKEKKKREKSLSQSNVPIYPYSGPGVNPLEVTDKIIETARAMAPPANSMTDMSKVLSDTLKAGVDMMKGNLPAPTDQKAIDPSQIIVSILGVLKESGLLRPPEKVDETANFSKMVTMMKDIGLFTKPETTDPLAVIGRLKETLGMKMPWEEKKSNAMEDVEKVISLANALRPIVNPDSAPPSTWQLIIEAIAKFGEPLINTLMSLVESRRVQNEYMIRMMGGNLPVPTRPAVRPTRPGLIPPAATVTPSPTSPNPPPTEQPQSMAVMVGTLVDAIKKKDKTYFDFIRQTLFIQSPYILDGLLTGNVTPQFLITLTKSQFGNAFDMPETVEYLGEFVRWLREEESKKIKQEVGDIVAGNGIVVGQCDNVNCKQEYEFPSEKEWDLDGKICGDCGGILQKVSHHDTVS